MFKKFLIHIRRKPKQVRENIAFSIAVSFTAVVFMVWLYHLPNRFEGMVVGSDTLDSATGALSEFQDQVATVREAIPDDYEVASVEEFGMDDEVSVGTSEETAEVNANAFIEEVREQALDSRGFSSGTELSTSAIQTSTTTELSTESAPPQLPTAEPREIQIITINSSSTASTTQP